MGLQKGYIRGVYRVLGLGVPSSGPSYCPLTGGCVLFEGFRVNPERSTLVIQRSGDFPIMLLMIEILHDLQDPKLREL